MTTLPAIQSAYPPRVYASDTSGDLVRAPEASLWVWFTLTAAAGVPAGLLWWLTAPGGAFYGSGTNAWLPRELTLGLIGIALGVLIGVLVARHRFVAAAASRTTTAVTGSMLGSLIAWQSGEWTASLFSPEAVEASVHPGAEFSLMSYGILVLWPASAALVVFLVTLISMLRTAPAEEPPEGAGT
ncbi:MAG TPA: hypothetical protein VFI97_06200 [Arthrobacter sp.]|nr:hypothetical protein [Arthrobacter sp.]